MRVQIKTMRRGFRMEERGTLRKGNWRGTMRGKDVDISKYKLEKRRKRRTRKRRGCRCPGLLNSYIWSNFVKFSLDWFLAELFVNSYRRLLSRGRMTTRRQRGR